MMLYFIVGVGLILMGIYTFTISDWNYIYIIVGLIQIIIGGYLNWIAFRPRPVPIME